MNEWEKCPDYLAHINLDNERIAVNYFMWNYYVANNYDFTNKNILDWGCGGGVFARWVSSYYNIKSYTGIDISQRSIDECKKHINGDFYKLPNLPNKPFDVLVCFAVIQHMTMNQYVQFLEFVEESNIPDVVLQIRWAQESKYDVKNLIKRLKLSEVHLENYNLAYESEVISSNHYKYLVFHRK